MGPVRTQQPDAVQGQDTINQREHNLTFSSNSVEDKMAR